jgi:hypothetical protein
MDWTMSAFFEDAFHRHASRVDFDLADPPEHWPPEDARRLRRSQPRAVVQRLPPKHDHVRAADLVNGRSQHARRPNAVNDLKRGIGDEDRFIRTHGERVLERILGGFGTDAQSNDRPTIGFFLLERALNRVLIERVDDQRRLPPCDLPVLGNFHFRFRVRHLLDAGNDFQVFLREDLRFWLAPSLRG